MVLFVSCMVSHGELARHKPPSRYLTSYYLSVAGGGALGSLFVVVVAPVIFDAYFELHLGLFACSVLLMASLYSDGRSALQGGRPRWAWAGMVCGVLALGVGLAQRAGDESSIPTVASRNFYGVLSITEKWPGTSDHLVTLNHGRINHGAQFAIPEKRR